MSDPSSNELSTIVYYHPDFANAYPADIRLRSLINLFNEELQDIYGLEIPFPIIPSRLLISLLASHPQSPFFLEKLMPS
jgi:hypothetical protein